MYHLKKHQKETEYSPYRQFVKLIIKFVCRSTISPVQNNFLSRLSQNVHYISYFVARQRAFVPPLDTTIVKEGRFWLLLRDDANVHVLSIRKVHSAPKLLHMILVRSLQNNSYQKYASKGWIGSDFFHLTNEKLANRSCRDWIKSQEKDLAFMKGEYQ